MKIRIPMTADSNGGTYREGNSIFLGCGEEDYEREEAVRFTNVYMNLQLTGTWLMSF